MRNTAGTNFPVSQTVHHLLYTWCAIPVSAAISLTVTCQFSLTSSSISLFAVLSTDSLQPTTKGLIGDVWTPLFKMLYPSPGTASAHTGISMYMAKSCTNIQCGDFLFNKKSYHCKLPTQRVLASHFLTLKYMHSRGR